MLIAQSDDSELLEWLCNAKLRGGHFISSFADAALVADWENYPRLRPMLQELRAKYPDYEPSDAVKAELKSSGAHSPPVAAEVNRIMDERTAGEAVLTHIEHRLAEFFAAHPVTEYKDRTVGPAFMHWLCEKDNAC